MINADIFAHTLPLCICTMFHSIVSIWLGCLLTFISLIFPLQSVLSNALLFRSELLFQLHCNIRYEMRLKTPWNSTKHSIILLSSSKWCNSIRIQHCNQMLWISLICTFGKWVSIKTIRISYAARHFDGRWMWTMDLDLVRRTVSLHIWPFPKYFINATSDRTNWYTTKMFNQFEVLNGKRFINRFRSW